MAGFSRLPKLEMTYQAGHGKNTVSDRVVLRLIPDSGSGSRRRMINPGLRRMVSKDQLSLLLVFQQQISYRLF